MKMKDHQAVDAEYRMGLRIPQIVGLFLVVLSVSGFMLYYAITNDRGLVLQGVLTLSRTQATVFYGVFSGLLGLGVLPYSIAVILKAIYKPQRVAFAGDGIFLPASFWSGKEVHVRFSEIQDLTLTRVRNEQILSVVTSSQKFKIGKSWLPSQEAFDDIQHRLAEGFQPPGST